MPSQVNSNKDGSCWWRHLPNNLYTNRESVNY